MRLRTLRCYQACVRGGGGRLPPDGMSHRGRLPHPPPPLFRGDGKSCRPPPTGLYPPDIAPQPLFQPLVTAFASSRKSPLFGGGGHFPSSASLVAGFHDTRNRPI